MNLTNDPWIPVVYQDNRHGLVSLKQIFSSEEQVRDIEVRPQDRISLMRLFICIAQASFDWPKKRTDHQNLSIIECAKHALDYLDRKKEYFNLFDKEKPFLQVPDLQDCSKEKKGMPLSKLDLCLATGNNPTVFDNLALDPNRFFSPATVALNLLTFQCMTPKGKFSSVQWKEIRWPTKEENSSAPTTPLLGAWHVYVLRETILETIYSNCINKKEMETEENYKWGVPIWEKFPISLDDTESWENAQKSYLGRLVPLHALVKIHWENQRMIWASPFCLKNRLQITRDFTDPLLPYEKGKVTPLQIDLTKGSWRDLPTILSCKSVKNKHGPRASKSFAIEFDKRKGNFLLWTGGLKNNKAKIETSIESYFYLPENFFQDKEKREENYMMGVNIAEKICNRLDKALEKYFTICISNEDEKKNPLKKTQIKKRRENIVITFYEQAQERFDLLLELIKNFDKCKEDRKDTEWCKYLNHTQRFLFFTTCKPKSPREYYAYTCATKILYEKDIYGK